MVFISRLSLSTKITLNNNVEIPILGLGTYQMRSGGETDEAVLYALNSGYRHIDTAAAYGNERDVGAAIKRSGVPREEIFVTTKVWNSDHGYEPTIRAFNNSLKQLDTTYVDLYLIHWPVQELRSDTWRAMEDLLEEGTCRAIGVSNYMIWHLEDLFEHSSTIPAINQVEFSPYLYQKDLMAFCQLHKIHIEAYSPLTKAFMLEDPKLLQIATKYHRTSAQILIRWGLQHGLIVIPKSSKPNRILENANVFDFHISPEDMAKLDSFNEDLRTGWDPSSTP